MRWTPTPPSRAGWYWFSRIQFAPDTVRPIRTHAIVRIDRNELASYRGNRCRGDWFAGPIARPTRGARR